MYITETGGVCWCEIGRRLGHYGDHSWPQVGIGERPQEWTRG